MDKFTVYGYEAEIIRHYRRAQQALAVDDVNEYAFRMVEAINYTGRVMATHDEAMGYAYSGRYNDLMVAWRRVIAAPDTEARILALQVAGGILEDNLQYSHEVEEIYYFDLIQDLNKAHPAPNQQEIDMEHLFSAPLANAEGLSNKAAYSRRLAEIEGQA